MLIILFSNCKKDEIINPYDDTSLDPPTEDSVDYLDRKSTRLNSSHALISYAVFCLKKKKTQQNKKKQKNKI